MLKPALTIAISALTMTLLAGCQHPSTPAAQPNRTLHLPPRDVLDMGDEQDARGTKLAILVSYSYIKGDSGFFRKNPKTYIRVWPEEATGFDTAKAEQGPGVLTPLYDRQSVAIGGWDGVLFYGADADTAKGLERIRVVFGSPKETYRAEGVFPAGDEAERDTILTSLFSLEDAGASQTDEAHFTLKTEKSGWWYRIKVRNIYYYAPDENAYPSGQLDKDQFMVIQFKPAQGFKASIRNMEILLDRFKQLQLEFPAYTIVPTRIGDMDAVEVTCRTTYRKVPNTFYAVLTGTREQPLLLAGWVYHDAAAKVASMKAAASTLRIKK